MSSPVGLWFDFTGAGFGSGAHDDCTALVTEARVQRGGTAELTGAAQPGQATFTMLNPGALFDPDNESGDLYGLLRDGVRVWWGVNEDGTVNDKGATVRGRFAGRVQDWTPLPAAGAGDSTPTVEVTAVDALDWYARTPVSLSADCGITAPPAASFVIGTGYGGLDTSRTSLWASDDGSAWHEVVSTSDWAGSGTGIGYGNYLVPIPLPEAVHAWWQVRYWWSTGVGGSWYYPGVDYYSWHLLDYATCRNYRGSTSGVGTPPGVAGDFWTDLLTGAGWWRWSGPGPSDYVHEDASLWAGRGFTTADGGGTEPPSFYDHDGTGFLDPRTNTFGVPAGVVPSPFTIGATWTVAL